MILIPFFEEQQENIETIVNMVLIGEKISFSGSIVILDLSLMPSDLSTKISVVFLLTGG